MMGAAEQQHWYSREVEPRLTVEAVFSPHVRWRSQRGRQWRAACPIHGSKSPTFVVNTETLLWDCKSCGAAGNPVTFLHCLEAGPDAGTARGMRAIELMRELAQRIGYDPERDEPVRPMPRPRVLRPVPEKPRPDVDQLWTMWRTQAAPPSEGAAAILEMWGIDAARVDDEVRVLIPGAQVPDWARCKGRTWGAGGYEILFPLRDPEGRVASFIARSLDPSAVDGPKSAEPAGHTAKGLVFMDAAARACLRGEREDRWCVVREGERDWLLDAQGPQPTIGVRQSAWSDALSRALPHGWHLEIATDPDAAGDRYAEKIMDSLRRTGRLDVTWERTAREEAR